MGLCYSSDLNQTKKKKFSYIKKLFMAFLIASKWRGLVSLFTGISTSTGY